jgi:CRISPR-associated protein Csy2
MTACPQFDHWVVLPHLRVQNANAVSSPLTHGFPAMSAFLGLMWALQRKLARDGLDITINAIGVVCHDHEEQVSDDFFVKTLRLTRNPVDKSGETAAIVERGRIHLDLSLVLAISSEKWNREPDARDADVEHIASCVNAMRIAGGTIHPPIQPGVGRSRPWRADFTGDASDRELAFRRARNRLLPGYTLVLRDDRLDERHAEIDPGRAASTRLDAWLSLSRINWRWQSDDQEEKGRWTHDRAGRGWIVPIPVGYGSLTELFEPGTVANTRDQTTPFRFVESVYSIGEWISPHRLRSPRDLLWYPDYRNTDGVYRCMNDYAPSADAAASFFDFD